jgi:hypothetical protein
MILIHVFVLLSHEYVSMNYILPINEIQHDLHLK